MGITTNEIFTVDRTRRRKEGRKMDKKRKGVLNH